MGATPEQVTELAGTVAAQAQAIADGNIPLGDIRAKVKLLDNNVSTLLAWTDVSSSGKPWWRR